MWFTAASSVPAPLWRWLGRVSSFPSALSRAALLAGILGGATTFNAFGSNSPFTGTAAPVIAVDGGGEVRIIRRLTVRVEGGYLHSWFTARYSTVDSQSSIHNQHGKLLIAGVWHF